MSGIFLFWQDAKEVFFFFLFISGSVFLFKLFGFDWEMSGYIYFGLFNKLDEKKKINIVMQTVENLQF